MRKHLNREITSWVAILIIIAIGSTFVYFIWARANDSWAYDYVYPQFNKKVSSILTKVETVGWSSYRDDGYGFQLRHPSKYSKTVSTIVSKSIIGNTPGTTVGPLVFVKLDTAQLKSLANKRFDVYWNFQGKLEAPDNYCSHQSLEKSGLQIRIATCNWAGKKSNYALIKGKSFDIFVDGSTSGYNKNLLNTYGSAGKAVSEAEFIQILSTFEFI